MVKRVTALAVAAVALTGLATAPGAAAAQAAPTGTDVAVGSTVAHTVAPTAIGANTPFWNPLLTRPDTPALIRKAGIRTLSFNAGGASDLYHTLQMLTTALKGGGSLLTTTTSGSATLSAHAVRRADGTLAVVVVNKDPRHAEHIRLTVPRGYHAVRTLTWHRGDAAAPVAHPARAARTSRAPESLAPYSATVVLYER
ncbi:glycoside hydrolase family 30 beta sandwich domain-containing protein [Streptomyces sp. WZ-12]|uniref:glycoside hydrolase family 30 beta sandwich domain-containing protein n=1 Tax=Streptomyces sp. WZ-12 TaxID=3030210 RepID=UPI002380D9B9|nr:glycoside hydrolase family 30 beta sandwich domain-containing protein [Streptomyces sp. WZ-12]